MGIFFTVGEKKVRAGVYQRYENRGAGVAGAVNGIVAAVYKSNWGPIGEVQMLDATDVDNLGAILGGGAGSTVDAIYEAFNGGAATVLAIRLGAGGTKGTITLKDSATTGADAVTLTAKHPGSRALKVTVRDVLGDSGAREFLVAEGDKILEKLSFAASDDGEVEAITAAINAGSAYFTAAAAAGYTGTGKLAVIAEQAITVGTDPTVTTADYSDAFALLEPHRFNTLCADTDDVAVHALLAAYIQRVYQGGKIDVFGVVGESETVAIATRMEHAAAFNDYNMVYVGHAVEVSSGGKLEGYAMAARIAGMVAAVPSNQSLTHRAIKGAVKPSTLLTNSQHVAAIKSGMMTFSTAAANGTVWIEQGITTLVTPGENDDEGWKKIKRAKIRKELMARVSDSVENMMGKINNNTDGQANVIKIAKDVCKAMWREEKLLPGYSVALDAANPPEGDSAWFNIAADDVDSIEKSYFVYGFRYSAAAV